MKRIRKVAFMSLILLAFSPIAIGYADESGVSVEEVVKQSKDEKSEVMKLTLSEAIEKALENSPEIEKSNLELKKAEVNYREGNYDIRANKKLLDDENEKSLNYLKMVTFLDFTNKFSLENSKRKDQVIRANIKLEVEELYFNLLQAQDLIDINKSSIGLAKKLNDIAQIKLDLGLGIKQDVLNSNLNYIKAKESHDQSIKNLENAKMLFNIKLGLDNLQKVELLEELEYKEFKIEDIIDEKVVEDKEALETVVKVEVEDKKEDEMEPVIKQALKNRNEIKLAEFSYQLEKLKMDIVKKEYPSITFIYRQQEVEFNKSKEALENMKNNIEMEIRSSYKELNQKKTEINSAKRTIELASEGLRIAKVNHELGMGILLDVENAQNKLDQAELALSNAIFKYNLDVLKFKTIAGLGRNIGGM